jgi:hypothetical protein
MTYDEIKKHAIAKCDEWFLSNPVYFHNKAKLIAEQWEAYNKESVRLNKDAYSPLVSRRHQTSRQTPHKKPSWIDPIWACVGKPVTKWNPTHCNENRTETLIPSNKDDALLIYVAALLILHDGAAINGAGLEIITENVWPKEKSPILWASYFFETNDRTPFIESALRHVEGDLASKAAKEKPLNASAIPPKTDAGTENKQQPWRDDDPDYMENSEAITTFTGSKMSLSKLSTMLRQQDNTIRWMRKGQRSKIHIGDFRKYTVEHYPTDKESAEVAEEFLADIDARKADVDSRKSKN